MKSSVFSEMRCCHLTTLFTLKFNFYRFYSVQLIYTSRWTLMTVMFMQSQTNTLTVQSLCSLSILHSYCVLIKTHMGKSLFSPELKSYSITQWNCTTIGSCSGKKRTNGSAAELHEPMATIPARSRQYGRGIWLYKRSFRHRILRFLLLQRRWLRLHWPKSLLAVDTPRSWTQRPRSARLIRLFYAPQHRSSSGPVCCRHPAIIT